MGTTGWPAASRVSTRRPEGRSRATGRAAGGPKRASRRRSSAKPAAECSTVPCQPTWPVASKTQTAWVWLAQSRPMEKFIAFLPEAARHCAVRGPAGRSLTGALGFRCPWRSTLWPVWASRGLSRGSRSHSGRRAASTIGSPRPLEVPIRPGLTSPNPLVGAVVVRDSVVVGEGFHAGPGRPHAEIEALRAAGDRAGGATLYVTLEPCAHQGRTSPCAPALVAAGLARVVVATGDPNPLVDGRGLEILRRAGIAVDSGLLADEARAQNRASFTWITHRRPHVTLKTAMTLDGKIAAVHGGSRWITGEAARAETHRLRSRADAIVVGIGTALADDPELTVRLGAPWPREPYRVVVDAEARLPTQARLIHAGTPA